MATSPGRNRAPSPELALPSELPSQEQVRQWPAHLVPWEPVLPSSLLSWVPHLPFFFQTLVSYLMRVEALLVHTEHKLGISAISPRRAVCPSSEGQGPAGSRHQCPAHPPAQSLPFQR